MRLSYVLPASFALISAAAARDHTFHPTEITAPFVEQFTPGWDKRWIPSTSKKVVDGVEDEDLLQYRGRWAVEAPEGAVIEGDEGLVVKDAAAHHAITALFPTPIDPAGKSFVAQYEVKLQNGLECGGAYMKLLTADSSFDPAKFADKTPYTIMFGPDKCGSTNKVHFIFRHKNAKTGAIEEKHLEAPPSAKVDKDAHLYTLIVDPDQTFKILVDNVEAKTGSLLKDFNPPVNPPKEIDDPTDTKPADWVDLAQIEDPEATKPDDWDEDAPLQIVDEDAQKPADWLDDAPASIPDPEAEKPEDWDDEEDGDWVAPSIPNPACEKASGCGEWTRPLKSNPAYKGKWSAPLIANPAYKGVWAPKKISNPAYYEDNTPSNFSPIGGIGFEIWTMQNGILFDNIYIGHSAADARKLAEETWDVKNKLETEKRKKEEEKAAKEAEKKAKEEEKKEKEAPKKEKRALPELPLKEQVKDQVLKFANIARHNPLAAIQELPLIAAGLAASILLPLLLLSSLFGGSTAAAKSKAVVKKPKEAVVPVGKEKAKGKKQIVVTETVETDQVIDASGKTKGTTVKRTVNAQAKNVVGEDE
ncbi:Calreticulin family-domain-containing protein [Fimicolochytrium jonesii]|uniref:Calreticulin family-domain-containing protein n=1 Tax=Fimicolochytrium jonesii TaxID=1396493 RepID=UPI0022FDF4FB|nr:Calreticulin family-domain-containing protein [Fimicolochytrium jonesii]KAI8818962.1 Calreticulin family-domain-containing protein [Fimicolochytrium jonesii]